MDRSQGVGSTRSRNDRTEDEHKPKDQPRKRRRTIGFMPLEPRIMYDGAAAAGAAAAHHHEAHHDPAMSGGPDGQFASPSAAAVYGSQWRQQSAAADPTPPATSGPVGGSQWSHNTTPAEPMPQVYTWVKDPTEIVFIDSAVTDYQALASGAKPGVEVVILNPNADGVHQIADFLSRHPDPNLTTVDIVANGDASTLFLGDAELSSANIGQYASQLAEIGGALQPGGDIALYACDVAQGAAGAQFIGDLSSFAGGVDVAAATHLVGSADLGGSWTLDAATGPVVAPSSVPFTDATLANFQGDLLPSVSAELWAALEAAANSNTGPNALFDTSYTGTGAASNETTSLATYMAANHLQPFAVALDTAHGKYVIAADNTAVQEGNTYEVEILVGSLTNLSVNPTVAYTFTTTNYDVTGFALDPVTQKVYLVGYDDEAGSTGSFFDEISFSGANYSGTGTLTTLATLPATDGFIQGIALDLLHNQAFFAVNDFAFPTYGPGSGLTGFVKVTATKPTLLANAIYKASSITSASTLTQLPISGGQTDSGDGNANNIPSSDGLITSIAVDPVTETIYFSTTPYGSGANAGIYSYAIGGSGTIGTVWTQTPSTTPSTTDELNDLTVDPANGTYFVDDSYNAADSINAQNFTIFEGSLSGGTPSPFVSFESSTQQNPEGLAVDDAPVVTASTHTTPTAVQDGTAVTLDSGIGISDLGTTNFNSSLELASATVQITGNPQTGDELTIGGNTSGMLDSGAISYSFSGSTLTLSGVATVAAYQTALDEVQFSTTSGASTSRTITFTANDGLLTGSATDTVDVEVLPTISSAAYNASNGELTVTGTGFTTSAGDYSATALTLTCQDGGSYTLTSGSTIAANPTSTSFVVDLSTADQLAVDGLLNKDGTSAVGGTAYNLAATSSFDTGGAADTTSAVTVSNALTPSISAVGFDYATGVLTLTGTGFENESSTGGLRLGDFTLKGQGGSTFTLTAADAAVSSETTATITLNGSELASVQALFDVNGTSAADGTTYNLAATAGWDSDAGAAITTEGVTVSGVGPTVTGVATLSGTEGSSFGPAVLATFTDSAIANPTASDFTATITWGDGTNSPAGESHVMSHKMLQAKDKWILKGSPDLEGDADGAVFAVFCRAARPTGGQCAARFDRDFVYRAAGDALRSADLLRHRAVREDQGSAAANGAGSGPWGAKPRYVQPRVPHARCAGFREGLPAVHASLCGDRAGCCCTRRQGAQTRLRKRQKSYAAHHGDGLERADPHGLGQCDGGGQQRSGGRRAAGRSAGVERLRRHRRCTALPSRDGASDPRTGWRLRACGQGQPARFAARCASRRRRGDAPGRQRNGHGRRSSWSPGDQSSRGRACRRLGRAARLSRSASSCPDHEQAQWQDRGALLPAVAPVPVGRTAAHRSAALEHRKWPALAARCAAR